MKNHNIVPSVYMTIGEIAKKMNVTVRTLQYYDKEGLLSPSSISEGGRRLYSDMDLLKIHQILSLKHLGFSLDEIKNSLMHLDTPADVARALTQQASAIQQKLESLTKSLNDIEMLRAEVLQMQVVDFKKYADIIVNLQIKNEFYWLVKHFDDETLDTIRGRFDMDSSKAIIASYIQLQTEAIQLQEDAVLPDSKQAQAFAKSFWDLIERFTGGDMSMLPQLVEMQNSANPSEEWKKKQEIANEFIQPALGIYLESMGYNPFGEETK